MVATGPLTSQALAQSVRALTGEDSLAFFDAIAPIVERTPAATRQLASRARRRVQGSPAVHVNAPDRDGQRRVVEAFIAASRGGDFEALLSLLDPDVVLRVDFGPNGPLPYREIHGAEAVASQASTYSEYAPYVRLALVNGIPGTVTAPDGKPFSVMAFTVLDGKIIELHILADPERLATLDLSVLDT